MGGGLAGIDRRAFLCASGLLLADLAVGRRATALVGRPGPGVRFLVDDPRFVYSRPCVSPSGDRVVYMRAPATDDPVAAENSNFSPWSLWTVPMAGGEPSLLLGGGDVLPTRPDWSPVSNRIAFTGITGREANLWLLDPETGSARRVALDPAYRDQLFYPTWYPDGERIAVTDYGARVLLEVWPDQGRVRPLTDPETIQVGMASVAPDPGPEPRIAFAGQRPGEAYATAGNRIWIRRPGGELTRLDAEQGRTPAWSPRGDRLAFSSVRARPHPAPVMRDSALPPTAMGIWVHQVGPDGRAAGRPRAVSPPDHAAIHPKWHPSGRALVCTMESLVTGRRGVAALLLEP